MHATLPDSAQSIWAPCSGSSACPSSAVEVPIEYLDRGELDALLKGQRSLNGPWEARLRHSRSCSTPAPESRKRLNVRVADVRLEAPPEVRLLGKGRKVRACPLWQATASLLRDLIAQRGCVHDETVSPLVFTNARGAPLTRYGVRYLLRHYVQTASRVAPSLKSKKLHPTRSNTVRRWRCSSPRSTSRP